MSDVENGIREGSLEAPTRHTVKWKDPEFYSEPALFKELERVYDICHGCRRCVSLCNAFPTLFDLVDESDTMEVDGVPKPAYWKVVDHCYLCDLCYMTKCPYVPPHPWNVDFPHLMLRAKAVKFKTSGAKLRDKVMTATDRVGSIAGIPVVAQAVNAARKNKTVRKLMNKAVGIHAEAELPSFHVDTLRKRLRYHNLEAESAESTEQTRGRVALFATCYVNRNEPQIGEDLISVYTHNKIPLRLTDNERCCGMPKLELGDLDAVERLMRVNIPVLSALIDEGWDIVAPVPSCVLMFKNELPLLFADEPDVIKVSRAVFDPFEYLMLRHKGEKLNTVFNKPLGKIAYHAPCHQRVQNIGLKTRDVLQLVPDTEIEAIERCSGHDGTYALKSEFHEVSRKIARPVVNRVKKSAANYFVSDCPMASHHIENGIDNGGQSVNPFKLLRIAYGI